MSTWMRNAKSALADLPVLLLHGNVRDAYIDEDGAVYSNLTAWLYHLAQASEQPFSTFEVLDLVSPLRTRHLRQTPAPAAGAATAAASADEERSHHARRQIARWRAELTSGSDSRFAVLFYLDKMVPYRESYSPEDAQVILWIEKLIENIAPNHRLVMVALRDTMVPVELYLHNPKVRLLPIPTPDGADRKRFLARSIQDAGNRTVVANLTDGLYLRDLERISANIANAGAANTADIRRVVNRYRIGDQVDYWANLDLEGLDRSASFFKERVKGQDHAVDRVVRMLQMARAGMSGLASGTPAKPKGVLFFAGPSGVGKTFLAKRLAEFLFSEEAYIRFDMSEFKEEHTVSKLIGSPPGYIGSERGGQLTNAVRERPFSVVLFDEIEKAHPKILDIFLQILDDGRLTDSRGQTTFFSEAVVIFTSNVGCRSIDSRNNPIAEESELTRINKSSDEEIRRASGETKTARISRHFVECVRSFFAREISRPELLNRIGGNIVPFNFIDGESVQREIVESVLKRLKGDFAQQEICRAAGYTLDFDPAVIDYFVRQHGEAMRSFGGRGLTNEISAGLIQPLLAPELLRSEYALEKGVRFRVTLIDNELVITKEWD